MLATDGTVSFALLLYEDPPKMISISHLRPVEVGFNAGDRQRYASIPVTDLQQVNVYRIEGEYLR